MGDSNYLVLFILPVVCTVCAVLIGLLVFPLPFSVRMKLIRLVSRFVWPMCGILAVLAVFFIQEFNEQRKFGERRRTAATGQGQNLHYFASEYFNHQRNMYFVLIAITLAVIMLILTRLLQSFLNEHNDLQDQLKARKESAVPLAD